MILDQLKGDIAFSGSRGVNDGGFTVLLHHFDCRLVGFCIVFEQLHCHPVSPLPERYSIFIMEYPTESSDDASQFFKHFCPFIDSFWQKL